MVDKNSSNFLPKVFQTKTNKRFLSATVDQLIQEPNLSRLYGYIGRQDLSPAYKKNDAYVQENDSYSQFYQLEPGLVINKRVFNTNNFAVDNAYNYVDLLNGITLAGGITNDHSRLFANEYYNYEGFIDLDKLVNYGKYYWLPNGPATVEVNSGSIPKIETYMFSRPTATDVISEAAINQTVGTVGFNVDKFPGVVNPTITLVRGGTYTLDIGQPGHKFFIQTQPGLSGSSSYQSNIKTRDVIGVVNNGISSGQIIFNVPKKDEQSFYETMPIFDNVDLVTDIPYATLQGANYKDFFLARNNIDSLTSFTYKRVLLTSKRADKWGNVPANQRSGIWQMVNNNGIIELKFEKDWPINTKIFVNEGQTYGHLYVFKDSLMRVKIVPMITASLDTLYYQDASDENLYGEIRIIEPGVDAIFKIEDIEGKINYVSPNGIKFTNGLKIKFTSKTIPEEYYNNEYIVEGVGRNIQLVPYASLITPDPNNPNYGSGYDANDEPYDDTNFDLTYNAPLRKDYIVVNRSSVDGNAWSRTNRWFHEDVILYSSKFVNASTVLDNSKRATRPIIEYDSNLKLFNHGTKFVSSVTVIDSVVTDIANQVEGHSPYVLVDSAGKYYSDNISLENNTFVIFINEKYEDTKNKIYRVENIKPYAYQEKTGTTSIFSRKNSTVLKVSSISDLKVNMSVAGTGIATGTVILSINTSTNEITLSSKTTVDLPANSILVFKTDQIQVHLIPVHTMSEGESVVAISGTTKQNSTYYWNNAAWISGQQKFSLNQYPLFDIFDFNGNSFSDQNYYPSSTFIGSRLFGYFEGSGKTDTELGIALSYRSIGNIGDIVFQNNYDTDKFNFSFNNADYELNINNGYVHEIIPNSTSIKLRNNWTCINDLSKQYVQKKFVATQYKNNYFPLDVVYKNSFNEKNIFVYVNDVELLRNVDFTLLGNKLGSQINLTNNLDDGDVLVVNIIGTSNNNKENYTLPKNLVDNSENASFETLTLGQIRNHLNEMSVNSIDYSIAETGNSNLRDINYKVIPGKILQHSAGVHTAQLMFNNESTNIIKAIDFSRRSYSNFKDRLFYMMSSMDFKNLDSPAECLDLILDEITLNSNDSQPFYYTDMIAHGSNSYIYNSYPVYDTNYRNFNLINNYDINDPGYNCVLVYLNDVQLLVGIDYTNSGSVITLKDSVALNINDLIKISEYKTTEGCMIPATPTKLGLYPKYTPSIYVDNSYIGQSISIIQGHDGSKTVAFGDYRDNIILEYEKRIYNNITVEYVDNVDSFSNLMPGAFRVTDYSVDEWTQLLSASFLNWAGNNSVNVFLNNSTISNDPFSFNYSLGVDNLFDANVPGYWRGIYKYFYDTDMPHVSPWEMIGFSQRPDWWVARYGPAPYTSGNLVLWNEMELGLVYQHGYDSYIDARYARPGLTSIIPADEHGELLPPISVLINGSWNQQTASATWKFGDQSPQETAWRRSSDYPFAVQIAWALARPAQYCNLSLNRRDLIRVNELNQIINKQTGNRKLNLLVTNADQFIPGSNIWLRDRLSELGLDIDINFIEIFHNYKLNLLYKTSSFTDKSYLEIIADQASPNSTNKGVLIPQENYHVTLTKSAPIALATYSAIVIQKSANGFKVYGFDSNRPYFTIIPRRYGSDNYTLKVSNSSAIVYNGDENSVRVIPYGTQFNTVQQVVDFLVSYSKYLSSIGFKFIDDTSTDTITTYVDWSLSIKEFLYWLEQGWDTGTVLSVTPAGTSINFDYGYGVVDAITNSFNGSRVINSNGKTLRSTDYVTFREGTNFSLSLKDETQGIHLIDIYICLYEHTIIFDNITVFNDIMFEPSLGNRQYRMKVSGFKTREWDGSLYAPGFLINHRSVDQWMPVTDYYKGDIVLHKNIYYTARTFIPADTKFNFSDWYEINGDLLRKQLIPNMAFNAQQFQNFYDVDTFDVNASADMLARNSTGFVPRSYLTNMGVDTIAQHKFYLGMIKHKGTEAAVNAFLRAKLPNLDNKIEINEQWALRLGSYGGTTQKSDIELSLSNIKTTNGSYVIELLNDDGTKSTEWNSFKPTDLLIKPTNYSPNIFAATEKNPKKISTAGPVLIDEVSATVFDIIKINNISGLAPALGEGSRIWVGADSNASWNVYRLCLIGTKNRIVNVTYCNLDNTDKNNPKLQFTTDIPHTLQPGNLVMIKNGTVGNTAISVAGFYRIVATGDKVFAVALPTNAPRATGKMKAQLYKLSSVRFPSKAIFAATPPGKGWAIGDAVWVDGQDSYSVLKNTDNWVMNETLAPTYIQRSDNFGSAIDIKANQKIMVVGAPNKDTTGSLYVYKENDDTTWSIINKITPDDAYASQFGACVKYNDLDYAIVGAPTSNTNRGIVYVTETLADSLFIRQAIYVNGIASGAKYGTDVAASKDGQWLAVGAPGTNRVYIYQLQKVENYTDTFVNQAGGIINNHLLPAPALGKGLTANDITIRKNGKVLIPYLDYTVGTVTILGTPTADVWTLLVSPEAGDVVEVIYRDWYRYVTDFTNTSASGSFGSSLSFSTDGTQLVVGAPTLTQTVNGLTYTNMGAAYIYQRSIEKFIANGTSNSITLENTPLFQSVEVENVKEVYKVFAKTTLDSTVLTNIFDVTGITVGMIITGINIRANSKVVSIDKQSNGTYNITMSQTAASTTVSAPVSLNFKLDYTISTNTLTFANTPAVSSIITVETNNFNLLETKTGITPQTNMYFGAKVVVCPMTCSLYVGATGYNTTSNISNGAVYRYVNSARLYGSIIGTNKNPLLNIGDSIRINGYKVTFTGYSSVRAALDINAAKIPGVYASVLNGNQNLKIEAVNNLAYNKIILGNTTTSNALNYIGFNVYDLYQVIYPTVTQNESNVNFGAQIAIDADSTRLIIGANLIKSVNYIRFADYSGTTTFDGNSTQFTVNILQAGAAYLYEYQYDDNETAATHGNFAYSKLFASPVSSAQDLFSTGVALGKNWAMITSLNSSRVGTGMVYTFHNRSGLNNWYVDRTQTNEVDIRKIERIYLYNDNNKTLITELPVISPEYGLPVRKAAEQIRYIVNYDPAIYTNTPNTYSFALDNKQAWGAEHVGELWWDTNAVKYVDWNQGSITNKLNTWGLTFPNSYIVVYEWIESDLTPSQYAKLNSSSGPAYVVSDVYSTKTFIDPTTLQAKTKYYFWIKNSQINHTNQKRETALTLQNLIANPRNANEPFAAVIGTNALALFNCNDIINNDTMLHISTTSDRYGNPTHEEWTMFDDGTDLGIAQVFLDRLTDSFAGQDEQGKLVPDNSLSSKERYGVSIRPRQTTFADNFAARKIWVEKMNDIFSRYPISLLRDLNKLNLYDEPPTVDGIDIKFAVETDTDLLYYNQGLFRNGDRALVYNDSLTNSWTVRQYTANVINPLDLSWQIIQVQTYDIRKYWTYTDWYSSQYNNKTQLVKTVDHEYDIANSTFNIGDVIKIKYGTDGLWKLVVVKQNTVELVGKQNGTISLLPTLYDNSMAGFGVDAQSFETTSFAADANIEFRKLFETINSKILNNELRPEYKSSILSIIDTIANQFVHNDWLLKTSFIDIKHNVRSLDEVPVYVNVSNLENIVADFISEVKPFHTKIKRYLSSYNKTDLNPMDITDFDLPAYYNQTLQTFRQPQLDNEFDIDQFNKPIYSQWLANHTYSIERIDIKNGGTGYTRSSDIEVTIIGDGVGATAKAYVRGGSIIDIVVDNPGSGYTYATVRIVSNIGKGATAFAILGNTKTRTFKTTIKFDRYTYAPLTVDWQPNTSYTVKDLIIYEGSVYRPALSSVGSNTNITNIYTTSNSFNPDGLIELKVRVWEPNSKFAKDDIVVYKNKAYVSVTDFTSGKYFNYNTDITVTHSTEWQSNTHYLANTIIVDNNIAYKVLTTFTSDEYFSSDNLATIFPICVYPGGYFDDAASRVWGYYSPISGMPGRDLTQLMTGLEYGGTRVIGPNFDQKLGYGFGGYDQIAYDQRTFDENGLLNIYGSSALDSNFYSLYSDTQLGLRSEDIIADGAGYVDSYSSYGPEEIIPGHMFDSLDIRVKTTNNSKIYKSPDLVTVAYYADNFTVDFSFDPKVSHTPAPIGGIESISVFSDFDGPLVEGIDYNINWENKFVEFVVAPLAPSSIFINLIGISGQNNINNEEFIGDGIKTKFALNHVKFTGQQIYVKVNGSSDIGWSLDSESEILTIQFDEAPGIGTIIQVNLYVLPEDYPDFKSYSEVLSVTDIVPDNYVIDPRGYYIELPEPVLYKKPWETKVSILINGQTIEPPNQAYYIGNGKTVTYSLPVTRNIDNVSLVTPAFIHVIVNGIQKVNQVDYFVNNNGTDIPTITLKVPPKNNDEIIISNSYSANFAIYDNRTLIIKDDPTDFLGHGYELNSGDVISITVYSNNDNYDVRTQVYSGQITTNTVTYLGFDEAPFDIFGFENEKDNVVLTSYTFNRPVTNMNNVEIYLNGTKLVPYYDFIFTTPTTFKLSYFYSVSATDTIIVKHISEKVIQDDIEFRIFKGITETYEYFGISPKTTTDLTEDLLLTDKWIYVDDISKLTQPDPVHAKPGVIFINGERITFYVIDFVNRRLGQIRRSTNGTGGTIHKAGSKIYDSGLNTEIPESRDTYVPVTGDTTLISKTGVERQVNAGGLIRQGKLWYNVGTQGPSNGLGIQEATTIQATFLREL